jgi:hypothetical protein
MCTAIARGDEEPAPPGEGVAPITAIEPSAAEALAVLDTPRGSADALPTEIAGRLAAHARFGMNPDLSRLALGQVANSLYVIPASGHVCVALTVGEGVGMSCPTTAAIADGRAGPVVGTISDGDALAILGLVPNGVETVTVRTDESSTVVEASANTYYTVVDATASLQSVSYDGPSGEVTWPIHSPLSVFEQ